MNAKTREVAAPTRAELRTRLEETKAALEAKRAQRDALADGLGDVVARSPVGDMSIARARRAIADLDTEIAALEQSVGILTERILELLKAEAEARWTERFGACDAEARSCIAAAIALQATWDAVIRESAAYRLRLIAWQSSLGHQSTEFQDLALPAALSQLFMLRLYAVSEGAFRAPNTFENPWQLLHPEPGTTCRVDLPARVSDWVRIGLRGNAAAKSFNDPMPPQAA